MHLHHIIRIVDVVIQQCVQLILKKLMLLALFPKTLPKKPEAIRLGVQAYPPPSSAQHTEYTWSDAWQFCATCGICKLAVLRPRIIFPCRGRGQGSCLARRCCPCRQCSGFFSLEPVVVIAGVRVHRPRHEDSEASHPSSVLSRRTQNRRQRWARC